MEKQQRTSSRWSLGLLLISQCLLLNESVNGLAMRPPRRERTRYFSQQLLVPPLERLDDGRFDEASSCDLSILYTNDPHAVSQWLLEHVDPNGCMLGFDVESVPDAPWVRSKASFLGPATVQIATTRAALVIQLVKPDGRFSQACVPLLEAILKDEKIVKVGCAIDDDMLALRSRFHGLEAFGRLELSGVCATEPGQSVGLKRLTDMILGLDLPKSRRLAASDWSQVPLSPAQIAYGARDAWAGAAIAAKLAELEPSSFALEQVLERLRSSSVRSLRELEDQRRKRKQAKILLKMLRKLTTITTTTTMSTEPLASLRLNLAREAKKSLTEYRRETDLPLYQVDLMTAGNFTS
ncbi:hypothetical protein MPSEU_000073800 [Mayamaea pseudoterrestris]|nr:hypothetical protein MPSEU_000073800 [Mayamaea pseudoterrestris]